MYCVPSASVLQLVAGVKSALPFEPLQPQAPGWDVQTVLESWHVMGDPGILKLGFVRMRLYRRRNENLTSPFKPRVADNVILLLAQLQVWGRSCNGARGKAN
jgi:hypothetical protein